MTEERFSIIDYPSKAIGQTIKIFYDVKAGSDYHVKRWSYNSVDFIAVLTRNGSGIMRAHEQEYVLQQGNLLVVRADELKDYNVDGESWSFLWFEFEGDNLPLDLYTIYTMPKEEWREEECEEILSFMKQNRGEVASASFTALLYKWADAVNAIEKDEDYTLVNRSIAYIRENIKNINVGKIAEAFYLSDRTLRNTYDRYLGMSPSEVIRRIRLKEAKNYLEASGLSIAEISEQLGYDSPIYFGKVFTKYVGISPTQYRNRANTFRVGMTFPEVVAQDKISEI